MAWRNAAKTRLLAVALVLGVVAGAPSASAAGSRDTPQSAFPISWKPCPDRPDSECGTLRVPLDWARPDGAKITLAVGRHRATDQAHRIGALFVNPGGPGGEGVGIAANADLIFSPELVSRFDIVGVDPRGIRGSTPVTCRIPDPQPGYTLFPRTEAQFRQMVALNRDLGRGCLEQTGPLLGHVDTVSVARDHEAVRIGLGERAFNWLGLSHGWPVPPANPAHPLDVRGVHPVLIVNATHDANTNYKWAHVVAGQVRGSVVFTRVGDGHTSYLVSPCPRAVIDRYLIDRALPGPSQVCTD